MLVCDVDVVMVNVDGLYMVCDYVWWRVCDFMMWFCEVVWYYETLNGASTTLRFGEFVDEVMCLSDFFVLYVKLVVCDFLFCCVIMFEDGVEVFIC